MKIDQRVLSWGAFFLALAAFTLSFITNQNKFLRNLEKVIKVYGSDDSRGRLLAFGDYDGDFKDKDLIVFSDRSLHANQKGQPSILLRNIPFPKKSVELGFYHFGPTLTTENPIFEFWLSNPQENYASLSILNQAGNQSSTARLELRYPSDLGALVLDSNVQTNKQGKDFVSRIRNTDNHRQLILDNVKIR